MSVFPVREKKNACLVYQRGSLVCFSREGNSVCLMDQRGTLVWISCEGISACLMNQPGSRCLLVRLASLDCFSRETLSACLNERESLFCVMYQPQRLCLSKMLLAMARVSISHHETVPVPPTRVGEPRAVQPLGLRLRTPAVLPPPTLPLSAPSQDEARTLRCGCLLCRCSCARDCR